MYAQADIDGINAKLRRGRMFMCLALIPFLAGLILGFAMRQQLLAILGCFGMLSVIIAFEDIRLAPLRSYRGYIRELLRGSFHETRGILVRQGDEDVRESKMDFREVIINIYRDLAEDGERRFLLDTLKAPLSFETGSIVVIRSQGTFIIDVQSGES